MKIVSNLLESIDGIQIWYIIALLIFFFMFIIFMIIIIRKPRKEMEAIKNSILDDHFENTVTPLKQSDNDTK